MSLKCNWPNCSMEFGDQKQLKKHLMQEHVQVAENGTILSRNIGKKQIFLPVETYVDILLWISRIELAQSISPSCWLFNEISRPRLDEQNAHIVPHLRFFQDPGNAGPALLENQWGVRIPIAQVPPPINILGFRQLDINYVNNELVEFLRLIKPILGKNVQMDISNYNLQFSLDSAYIRQLGDILAGAISHLNTYILNLNLEFIKKIQFVRLWQSFREENEKALEWLHSPMLNEEGNVGKTRCISVHQKDIGQLAEIFKKRFLASNAPVSFVIRFETIYGNPTPFSIENRRTGEQLTLGEHYDDEGYSHFLLRRSPIGDDWEWRQLMRPKHEGKVTEIKLFIPA